MAPRIFGDTVPREQYEDMKEQRNRAQAALDAERERYGALVGQFVDMRRHQEGMHPKNFDATASDPMRLIGPLSQAAVEEMSGGDTELRLYLLNRAYMLTSTGNARGGPEADQAAIDEEVASQIMAGDTT